MIDKSISRSIFSLLSSFRASWPISERNLKRLGPISVMVGLLPRYKGVIRKRKRNVITKVKGLRKRYPIYILKIIFQLNIRKI